MNVAIVPAAAPVVPGTAPVATRSDATADALATFAATLDRSREALAAEPAKADGALAAVRARKSGPSREQPSNGAGAQPDPLALLLAGAAASHVNPPPRTPPAGDALHGSRSSNPDAAAAHALPAASNPQELPGHDLPAVLDRLALDRPAPGLDRAGDRAAALAAAIASPAPARAAAPAADAGAAPEGLAAGVDLAALAGHARVPGRDAGTPDRSHALPSSVAAHAAPALPAAADAAAAALSASAFPGSGGRAHEHQPAGDDPADPALPTALAGAAPAASDAAMPVPDATATVAPPVGSSEWAPALAHQIARLAPGRSQIQLDLHPAELGPLTVKLTVGAAQAQVLFVSEHAAVREALQAALPQLRTSLEGSGISLGQASVGGGSGGQASAHAGGGEAPPRREEAPRPARTAAADPRAPVRTGGASGLDAFA